MWPSTDPENATPGNALTAADCAGLQRARSPQPTAACTRRVRPCRASARTCRRRVGIGVGELAVRQHDAADVRQRHVDVRRRRLPSPTARRPSCRPRRRASARSLRPDGRDRAACTMPDFWPATSARRPFDSVTRIGDALKSKSGPFDAGQLVLSGSRQPTRRRRSLSSAGSTESCRFSRSSAMNASLVFDGGSL